MSRELIRRIEQLEEENRRLRRSSGAFSQNMSSAVEETRKLRKEIERQRRERDFDWDIGY